MMPSPLAAPYAVWMKMWEVGVTAPLVISYRLAGMGPAGSPSSARHQREVALMGQEKLEAWYEGSLAAGMRMLEVNTALAGQFWRQAWGGASSPALTTKLAELGTALMGDSLNPVHRRVVANHRRLSRVR